MALYKALAANGNANKNIRVQDAVPADLMDTKKEYDNLAAKMRRDNPGLRTRVLCRGGEMALFAKDKDCPRYERLSQESLDLEFDKYDTPRDRLRRPVSPAPIQN